MSVVYVVLVMLCFSALAQPTLCTKNKKAIELYVEADNYRVRRQFGQAMEMLNEAIRKDQNFCEAYYRLALVYHDLKEYKRAINELTYGLKVTEDPKKKKVFYYDLGSTYLLIGGYEKAKEFLTLFLAEEKISQPKIDQAKFWLETCEYGIKNRKNLNEFQPQILSDTVNCFVMQYFPVLTADEQQLFFTRRNGIRGTDTEDLVVSTKDSKGRWSRPVSVSPNINSPENEGTCSVSADGRLLIFTSCRGRQGFGSCDLFFSAKQGDEWSEPVNLGPGVNSQFWESQPSLSADGRVLYFVSERKVGVGGKDIFVSYKNDKGEWSQAVNLGPTINTKVDDLSPFIHANNRTLFFASKGRVGFGGYDIFVSEKIDNTWTEPRNFGAPVNNFEDQFSLFITADGKKGYYSHEKELNDNTGRIYEINLPEDLQIEHRSNYVKGIVSDAETKKPTKARIELLDLKKNTLVSVVSSDSLNGKYLMVLTKGSDYGLFVSAPGYLYKSFNFNFEEKKQVDPIVVDIQLQKARSGASMVLNNIFFDYGKFDLKTESISELEKVVKFLTENPKIKIEISGHTDNQGTEESNQILSGKRASSVADFLISKSIVKTRIQTIGHGSKKPIRDNDTEENRSVNRRIEFKILE
jgi:outer membrane protein OmpA-like peptidoglycan-associated protein